MILAAHQPQFMPWLGYLHKMARCDVFVLLDDVQFKKNEFQNRNKIWSAEGGRWLTVPVLHKFPQDIREVRVNNEPNWRDKERKTLAQTYSRAAHFKDSWGPWDKMYSMGWDSLLDINLYTIEELRRAFGVRTPMKLSSGLGAEGRATERLVNICRKEGADAYLSGAGGRDYLETGLFEKAGIRLFFQEFKHPVYPQFGGEFVPHLSALDAVFHLGPKAPELLA